MVLLASFVLCSCAQLRASDSGKIDKYCQDLNVVYQKATAIASNIANVETTRTIEGGVYKRKVVKNCRNGFCEIQNDESAPILKYEPKHPDANKNGYVAYPNINLYQEKADQLFWEKVYNAVLASSPVPKNFFLKDPRAISCFSKYPNLKSELDFSEYLGRDIIY